MGLFKFILSGESRRNLKKLDAMADKVLSLEDKYSAMKDDELRGQTDQLKNRLKNGETLDDILYDAFAVVREAAWRVLKMKHYKVQIMGGICLHQGRVAEMKTGEGKTLVATLPCYLNALTGEGVHVVTVNDYLAQRDAEWMGKIYKFLGLTVGVAISGMEDEDKKKAYAADITYGTNNEMGFDYLRDNLKGSLEQMVQRQLSFAIVDEVDSILIDEARTPLIISGKGEESSEKYITANKFVRMLHGGFNDEKDALESELADLEKRESKELDSIEDEAERSKVENRYNNEINKIKTKLDAIPKWDYILDRKEKSVQITEQGATKAESFFGLANFADIENATLSHHIQQALKANYIFKRDNDYVVTDGEVIIVDEFTGRLMIGRRYSDGLHQAIEAKEGVKVRNENKTYATITFQNYFRLYKKLSGMTGTAKSEEEEFRAIYGLDVLEIPTNKPVARIDSPDVIYKTVNGKNKAIVKEIVERNKTGQPVLVGTVTVEKSEEISKMLIHYGIRHNVLNAKNHAREAEIVAQAGRFGAVTIATNMAGRGTDILLGGNPEFLAKRKLKEEGIGDEVIELATSYIEDIPESYVKDLPNDLFNLKSQNKTDGTDKVDTAENNARKIEEVHKIRERYKQIYEEFKTQTDAEKEKVTAVGGLHILGTERHESRRIDNQLRGRSGRQGDSGSSVFFISLEDDLAKRFGGERMQSVYNFFGIADDEAIQSKMISRSIENAQKSIEGRNFGIRKHVLEYDDVMNKQREVMYAERMKVIKDENVHDDIIKLIPDFVRYTVSGVVRSENKPETWDLKALNSAIELKLLPKDTEFVTKERASNWDFDYFIEKLTDETIRVYEEKIERYKEEGVDFSQVEKMVLLKNIDSKWIDHIDAMDQLKKGISLRGYGNIDPVVEYKKEGFEMFEDLTASIQDDTITLLLKAELKRMPTVTKQESPQNLSTNASTSDTPMPKKAKMQIGRNDPCPCGSGKKYKNCCGKN